MYRKVPYRPSTYVLNGNSNEHIFTSTYVRMFENQSISTVRYRNTIYVSYPIKKEKGNEKYRTVLIISHFMYAIPH